MPHSSVTKTSWSSDYRHAPRGEQKRDRKPVTAIAPLVELQDVALKFVSYYDKQYSLKRAAIDMLLRRDAPVSATEFWALRDVSLAIHKGERLGIIGANGAGKSTLLRLMAKIYPPSSGTLKVRGTVAR